MNSQILKYIGKGFLWGMAAVMAVIACVAVFMLASAFILWLFPSVGNYAPTISYLVLLVVAITVTYTVIKYQE